MFSSPQQSAESDFTTKDSGFEKKISQIIFLGTGTSEGVPRVSCLTKQGSICHVCHSATASGSKNRRRNTSLLIQYAHPDGRIRNIIIDTGKTFWQSALDLFPVHGVRKIDAIVLTHAHADAIAGLDDLRDWTNNVQKNIPVYLRRQDLEVVSKMFFYLVSKEHSTGGGGVAKIDFRVINETPFHIDGLRFSPLPVWHGQSYTALGFRFGPVAYISDVSEIPVSTEHIMSNANLLILDALRTTPPHGSHMILDQSLEVVRRLRPKKTLFTDMTHDFDHDQTNVDLGKLLHTETLDVQLAHDGMTIPVAI